MDPYKWYGFPSDDVLAAASRRFSRCGIRATKHGLSKQEAKETRYRAVGELLQGKTVMVVKRGTMIYLLTYPVSIDQMLDIPGLFDSKPQKGED